MGKEEDDKKEDVPYVHLWLKFGQVSAIYPIQKPKATVTKEELAKEDKERWVEIPDDYLKTKLDDIALNQLEDENSTKTDDNDNDDNNETNETDENEEPKQEKDFVIVIEHKQQL